MSNAAAIGYAIIAAIQIGLTPEQIRALERAMYDAMDEHTEYEAEGVYRKS